MITGLGIDIVETKRIKKDLDDFGERFVKRILGADEIDLLQNRKDREQFLAGRFAAKEAAIKAMGKYLKDKPPFYHIQILRDTHGMPQLVFNEDITHKLAGLNSHVSISHEKNYAVAIVILEEP